MDGEWISQNEYMKRTKLGYNTVKQLIATKQIEAIELSGQIRIRVNANTVPRDLFEKEKERRIRAETKLQMLTNIILGGNER